MSQKQAKTAKIDLFSETDKLILNHYEFLIFQITILLITHLSN